MAASMNRVFLMGNICKEIELRHTAGGTAVASFSLATNEKFKNKAGEWEDKAEFHSIVIWGKTAENTAAHMSKGSALHIEGRLQTRKWTDKDNKDRWTTEIVGDRVQFLGGKSDSGAKPQSGGSSYDEPTFNDESDIPFS